MLTQRLQFAVVWKRQSVPCNFSISDVCGTRHGRSVGWRRADYLMGVPATRSCNTHWTLLEKSSRRSPGR